ncbi:uncharacterized protein BJX67DRAFT_346016 [Aspergillus lucknowensis]|uniref:Uncharacterized protein n=1 Tax=Aspergillus lucknowensis TaxID=176173 RepID=A0ABR4M2N5_9EURO
MGMLQPRAMLLRPRLLGWKEPSILSIRLFSVSRTPGDDSAPPPHSYSQKPQARPKTLKVPPALLKFKSSNTDKPRPRRIVDARSLAASKTGSRLAKVLKGPGHFPARAGTPSRAPKPNNTKQKPKKDRRIGRRPQTVSDGDENDSSQEAMLENVYRELAEQTKPTPTRYQPQPPDFQSLSETWPSLPTSATATTAGIVEKLSLLSDHSPNGHIPPHFLGKRLSEGQYVRFTSEEEKAEALEAAKKFMQEDADILSQEKGELVDPKPVEFQSVNAEEHMSLIQCLAQGKYPLVGTLAKKPPVVGEVLRSLRNNETYQAAGKESQFMAKLESLLAPKSPPKRA